MTTLPTPGAERRKYQSRGKEAADPDHVTLGCYVNLRVATGRARGRFTARFRAANPLLLPQLRPRLEGVIGDDVLL
jgi:hypothetical protein